MPELERDHWEGACNEPQPFNWKHACQRPEGHRGEHRVNKGADDITWTGDGPVEIKPAKSARTYITKAAGE